jgi:hypothetical protein
MFDEESHQIRNQQKFLQDVEHAIRDINRTVIHAKIPALTRETFVAFAAFVAKLRADYLHAALQTAHGGGAASLDELTQRRLAFEEARAAFAALERAIERGYVDIG